MNKKYSLYTVLTYIANGLTITREIPARAIEICTLTESTPKNNDRRKDWPEPRRPAYKKLWTQGVVLESGKEARKIREKQAITRIFLKKIGEEIKGLYIPAQTKRCKSIITTNEKVGQKPVKMNEKTTLAQAALKQKCRRTLPRRRV